MLLSRMRLGLKRVLSVFVAIFVGYEEHHIGWRVHDLTGKYSFSNDVIFNENLAAHLGVPRSLPPVVLEAVPSFSRPICERPRICTSMGQAYYDVLELKRFRDEA